MTLQSDLIAAKALIDTPEKLEAVGSVLDACRIATGGDTERESAAFHAFMREPGNDSFVIEAGVSYIRVTFASFLDRFDRAIKAAS